MSRTNLILGVVLVVLALVYAFGRDSDSGKTAGPAPRLFPSFNKEAVDRIEIDGGWPATSWSMRRSGSDWLLASAGDFPLKTETANKFIDAVFNLRSQNVVGSSKSLQEETGTDDGQGRRVKIFKGETPMAAFLVGQNPKGYGSYQEFFIREEAGEKVYRTRTILTEDQAQSSAGGRANGFAWHNFVNQLHTEWIETKIWDLGDAETSDLWLTRGTELDVRLVKKADDKWDLIETGKDPAPADVDATSSITSQIRYLYCNGVLGKYEDVAKDCGLDQPEVTLVMTLKKKAEKKPEEAKPEGEEKEDEAGKEEYVTFKRTIEVGNKVTVNRDYDRETGKVETEEYYAIRIGGEFDDPQDERRSAYVYLVSDYRVSPLKKELDELKQKEEEKDSETEEEGQAQPETPEQGEPEGQPTEETPTEDKPAEDKPAEEEPAKEDEPAEEKPG